MKMTVLGIDLANNVFPFHGVDDQGKVVVRKQLTRSKLLPFVEQLTPCCLGMEACQGAHYWVRAMRKLGHDVRLMRPQFVTPYRHEKTSPSKLSDGPRKGPRHTRCERYAGASACVSCRVPSRRRTHQRGTVTYSPIVRELRDGWNIRELRRATSGVTGRSRQDPNFSR